MPNEAGASIPDMDLERFYRVNIVLAHVATDYPNVVTKID